MDVGHRIAPIGGRYLSGYAEFEIARGAISDE
jgi:hypothetical protein